MKTFKYIILMFVGLLLLVPKTKAQSISLPLNLADTTAPAGATLEYHNGLPISASNLVANPSNVDTGKYYIVYNYGGACYSDPTQIRVLQPICPLKTVNIANYIDTSNMPLGMKPTLHSGLPISSANMLPTSIQPAGKYYVGYLDLVDSCYSTPTLYIVKNSECTTPDNNATYINLPISGNVSTNDNVSPGTAYGNPAVNPSNPSSCAPSIAANGTYTFVCATPGKYEFNVPVCPPGQTTNCPTELLTITVLPLTNIPPVANTDVATTPKGTPVNVNVKANDFTANPGGSLGNPTITTPPSNGTASVNPDGTIKYTPNPTFVGKDTVYYQICDTTLHPAKCDIAKAIITVLPPTPPNSTKSADDFATTKCTTPAIGNALLNDTDPELNKQNTIPQTVVVPNKGTFTLDSNGNFTFTAIFGYIGSINFPYTTFDNGSPVATSNATIYIVVGACDVTKPDFNETFVNVPVNGNVSTNDNVTPGTAYGAPIPSASNPSACAPAIASDGSYYFSCNVPGKYIYKVPVCPPGQSTNCPLELLTITVLDKNSPNPEANTDVASTKQNTPVTVNILSNDKTNNPNGSFGLPTITTPPSNGTAVINPDGTLNYTPNSGFIGIDTVHYQVCDTTLHPAKCDDAIAIISILPPTAHNTTTAADDYNNTKGTKPVSGNVKTNDVDPEGNTQMVTPQTITNAKGTLVLNADGTYTFTPAFGTSGPIDFPYTTCDNGTPQACATATLHILVSLPDVLNPDFNTTQVNVPVNGNMQTNDVVPAGSTYGTPIPNPNNPSSCLPIIAANGTYTFTCDSVGQFNFLVPVCSPGTSVNCPLELLTITVYDPNKPSGPVANTDITNTPINTPKTLNIVANDKVTNTNGKLGLPVITKQGNNGSGVINADGTLTYTPNPGFTGIDTIVYSICDTTLHPAICDQALVIINILPDSIANTTTAADDYNSTVGKTPAKGNVMTNDSDPQGDLQTVTPQNATIAGAGTIVLNPDGSYTFTPNGTFVGTVDIPYTTCDNGTPQACASATLHIVVEPGHPDLTPTILLPSNTFAVNESKNFVVYLEEIKGYNTALGVVAFRINVPTGYKLEPYATSITNIVPSAGLSQEVSNAEFTLVSQTSSRIVLQAKPSVNINALNVKFVGFTMTRVNSLSQASANITVGIYADPTKLYDCYTPNNSYSKIIVSQ